MTVSLSRMLRTTRWCASLLLLGSIAFGPPWVFSQMANEAVSLQAYVFWALLSMPPVAAR